MREKLARSGLALMLLVGAGVATGCDKEDKQDVKDIGDDGGEGEGKDD